MQQKYIADLKSAAADARAIQFPYAFYFSRTLDVDEPQQQRLAQGSMRFDKFNGETVLQVTGNYYASYASELMNRGQRVRQTFNDVMLPILKAVVPHFAENESVDAFALEVSHHVRQKVLGVDTENAENVALVIPRAAAVKLVAARNEAEQQSAILEGQVFLNTEPIDMFLTDDATRADATAAPSKLPVPAHTVEQKDRERTELASVKPTPASLPAARPASLPAGVIRAADLPPHDTSPQVLHAIATAQQPVLQKILHDLDLQAHFVPYASPTVIAFHGATYLQFSVSTTLASRLEGSRYKLAALAFDEHVSHLVRPMLGYFPEKPGFDGIDFSTTVRLEGDTDNAPVAVEYILPLSALRCYQAYDCTGQQLLDSGFVLVNGERVGLDLETAEASH